MTRQKISVFSECPFSFELAEFEKTGLDIIFFGQNHFDTMAILQQREGREIKQDQIGALIEGQKLLSNKSLMVKNFEEVVDNLKQCEDYINEVDGDFRWMELDEEGVRRERVRRKKKHVGLSSSLFGREGWYR